MDHRETTDNQTGGMLTESNRGLGERQHPLQLSGYRPGRRTSTREASSLSSAIGEGTILSGTSSSVRILDGIRSSCVPLAGRRVLAWRPALPHFGSMGWLLIIQADRGPPHKIGRGPPADHCRGSPGVGGEQARAP